MSRYHWRAQGEANFYVILLDGNWFAVVQLNGQMLLQAQLDHMDVIVKALNGQPIPL